MRFVQGPKIIWWERAGGGRAANPGVSSEPILLTPLFNSRFSWASQAADPGDQEPQWIGSSALSRVCVWHCGWKCLGGGGIPSKPPWAGISGQRQCPALSLTAPGPLPAFYTNTGPKRTRGVETVVFGRWAAQVHVLSPWVRVPPLTGLGLYPEYQPCDLYFLSHNHPPQQDQSVQSLSGGPPPTWKSHFFLPGAAAAAPGMNLS